MGDIVRTSCCSAEDGIISQAAKIYRVRYKKAKDNKRYDDADNKEEEEEEQYNELRIKEGKFISVNLSVNLPKFIKINNKLFSNSK